MPDCPQPILSVLPDRIRLSLKQLSPSLITSLEEIRLRANRPLAIHSGGRSLFVTDAGNATTNPGIALRVETGDVTACLRLVTGGSLYTVESELRQGFMTVRGGHRVGIAGQVTLEQGHVRTYAHIQSVAIRIARQVPGCSDPLEPRLFHSSGRPHSILVISPPLGGKTTLLRDLARRLSDGTPGQKVVIVDERSEIAACYQGIPQLEVGCRTDVLDRCPKADGIMMAIRSLSPEVIVTDELGRPADLAAVREALNCGVSVITSAHADNIDDLRRRPSTRELVSGGLFDLIVELAGGRQRGRIAGLYPAGPGSRATGGRLT